MKLSTNHRQLLIISGKQSDCIRCAKDLTKNLKTLDLDNPKKASNALGQEFDAVIFNSFSGFDVNAFGAVSGTIRAGGFLLLLKPETYPVESNFLKRFYHLLSKNKHAIFIDPLKDHPRLPRLENRITQTTLDQVKAVEAIIHVLKGHRRRPLLITADRGRGKSASLGMAAAKLLEDGYKKIIVCAPSKKNAAVVYQFAEADKDSLKFYSPDELNLKKPAADLLLIDEAAAIPVPLLTKFLKHYSRIVFSTTQHGYEGSGRGFSINFHKVLDSITPDWKRCELHTPIRWSDDDALENFVFDALLLNAEPVDKHLVSEATVSNCQFVAINKQALLEDDKQLKSIFGLLVGAHYQTKPSDLMQMLDDDAMSIYTLQFNQQIIAVALLIREGGIAPDLCHDIFAGKRRLKGNLVAQSLAANIGIEDAPTLLGERISRIAVHPALQQQGFGTHLLEMLIEHADFDCIDYLSTSFGATLPVINFWKKAGFISVYLGIKRDASSGTHSVLMLHPKSKKGRALLDEAQQRFTKHFPHLLSEPFKELETDIALELLASADDEPPLSEAELNEVKAFAHKQRGYESSIYPLWKLVCKALPLATNLDQKEKEILLRKVLQKHAWQEVVNLMEGLSGKKAVMILLRQAVAKLIF